MIKQTICEFFDFIKSPQQSFRSNHKVGVIVLCGAIMVLINISTITLNFIYGYFRLDFPDRALSSFEDKYFLYHLLLVPIIEEIGFRLYLIPKRRNILLSSVFVVWIVYPMIITAPESPTKYTIIHSIISMAAGLVVFLFLGKIIPHIKYSYFFYFSALFFGSLHFNAFIYDGISFFSFLYVLLSIILATLGGIVFGYIRVSLGIIYSILFHFLINFLPIMAAFEKI